MRNTKYGLLIFGALAAMSVGACARHATVVSSEAGDVAPATGPVTVHVKNNNFSDMDVFAVRSGVPFRLGMVVGGGSGNFSVDNSLIETGQLRLVATPIGGSGAARTGPLLVSPGSTVNFTIETDLATSSATVR